MRKLVLCIGLLLVLLVSILVSGCTPEVKPPPEGAQPEKPPVETRTIRFAHIYGMDASSCPHAWVEKFRELVEKEFPGRFRIEEYGLSSLYKTSEVTKAAQSGAIEVGYGTTALASFCLPKGSEGQEVSDTFLMPGLFAGRSGPVVTHMMYDFWKTHGDEFSKRWLEPYGTRLGGFWVGNICFEICSTKPLTKLEDFAGLKTRIIVPWTVKTIVALGAKPVSLDTAEVPGALITRTIDASITWSDPVWRNKWYKSAKYMLPVRLIPAQAEGNYQWNLNFWNSLDEEVKKKFEEFFDITNQYVFESVSLPLQWNLEELFVADGATIPEWSELEIARVQGKLIPLREEWIAKIGPAGKTIIKWAEEIASHYTSAKEAELKDKYYHKVYPLGWESLAYKWK